MEYWADKMNAQFNSISTIKNDTPFEMVFYVAHHNDQNPSAKPRVVCPTCKKVIPLFKKVFPNAKIIFADQDSKNTGKCY